MWTEGTSEMMMNHVDSIMFGYESDVLGCRPLKLHSQTQDTHTLVKWHQCHHCTSRCLHQTLRPKYAFQQFPTHQVRLRLHMPVFQDILDQMTLFRGVDAPRAGDP